MNIAFNVNQAFKLVYFAQNFAFYKSLTPYRNELEHSYWTYTLNNFLAVAVLEWCKVFGARTEDTHWLRNYNEDEKEQLRIELLASLDITKLQWRQYWEKMKTFRDMEIAHSESSEMIDRAPDLHIAFAAACYYYNKVINELRLSNINDYPDDLESYYIEVLEQAGELSSCAYEASKHVKDSF